MCPEHTPPFALLNPAVDTVEPAGEESLELFLDFIEEFLIGVTVKENVSVFVLKKWVASVLDCIGVCLKEPYVILKLGVGNLYPHDDATGEQATPLECITPRSQAFKYLPFRPAHCHPVAFAAKYRSSSLLNFSKRFTGDLDVGVTRASRIVRTTTGAKEPQPYEQRTADCLARARNSG